VPGTASNLTCNRPHCLQQQLHDLARIAKRAHWGRILFSWSVCSCARYSQKSRTRSRDGPESPKCVYFKKVSPSCAETPFLANSQERGCVIGTTCDSPPPRRPRSFYLLVSVVDSAVLGQRPPSGRMRAGSFVGWSGGRAKVGAVHDWVGAWLPYTRTYRLLWRTLVAFLSFLMLAVGATVIGRRPLLQQAQVARSEGLFGGVAGNQGEP